MHLLRLKGIFFVVHYPCRTETSIGWEPCLRIQVCMPLCARARPVMSCVLARLPRPDRSGPQSVRMEDAFWAPMCHAPSCRPSNFTAYGCLTHKCAETACSKSDESTSVQCLVTELQYQTTAEQKPGPSIGSGMTALAASEERPLWQWQGRVGGRAQLPAGNLAATAVRAAPSEAWLLRGAHGIALPSVKTGAISCIYAAQASYP